MDGEPEAILSAAAHLKRTNLATAIANAKEAEKMLRQAQYALSLAQLPGLSIVMDARGALARLLDELERQGREMWGDQKGGQS